MYAAFDARDAGTIDIDIVQLDTPQNTPWQIPYNRLDHNQ
jgi:hypothetical protein